MVTPQGQREEAACGEAQRREQFMVVRSRCWGWGGKWGFRQWTARSWGVIKGGWGPIGNCTVM